MMDDCGGLMVAGMVDDCGGLMVWNIVEGVEVLFKGVMVVMGVVEHICKGSKGEGLDGGLMAVDVTP